jgi:ankyrin repeat protein
MRKIALALTVCAAVAMAGSRSPLIEAARNGDKDALRELLGKEVDVNAVEGDGATALHWSSYRDDIESAGLLIRAGANVNAANDLGVTPLWTACQNGSAGMVRQLLDAGANPNAALLSGETSVMVGARTGNPEVVQLLIAAGANVNARAARSQTALMWAVAQKHSAVVKVLLEHGADIHARSSSWSQMMAVPPHGYAGYNRMIPHGGYTAMMFAARVGDLACARLLVAAGGDVNDQDAWGVSATVLAAHSGYTELVEFLLEKGADPNRAPAGFTALHAAIMRRDERMVRALLAHGADPNTPLRAWTPTRRSSQDFHFEPALVGATPFWLAARFIQPGVMRVLAERGADPRFVHRSEYVVGEGFRRRTEATTAIMAAVGMGGGRAWVQPAGDREPLTLETVQLAAEFGIDINAVSADGRTALDGAQAQGLESVVKFLIEKGARSGPAVRR